MGHRIFAGAARRCVTPPRELWEDLRGSYNTRIADILDDFWVRAIAIGNGEETVLFVSYEFDGPLYPDAGRAAISKRFGIPVENIFYGCTHNHSGPIISYRPSGTIQDWREKEPEVQAASLMYEHLVWDAMLEAVEEAVTGLRPARLGFGEGESFINTYKSDMSPTGPIDHRLFLLKLEEEDGRPMALLLNFSMHIALMWMRQRLNYELTEINPEFKGPYLMTTDVSGMVSHLLEARFPGTVAMWTNAAQGGDMEFRMDYEKVKLEDVEIPDFCTLDHPNELVRHIRTLALRQYGDALKILEGIRTGTEGFAITGTIAEAEIPTQKLRLREDGNIAFGKAAYVIPINARQNTFLQKRWGPYLQDNPPQHLRMRMVRLGDLVFLGFAGNLYNSIAMVLRMKSLNRGDILVTVSNDACQTAGGGYILDDHARYCFYKSAVPYILPGVVLPAIEKTYEELCSRTERRA